MWALVALQILVLAVLAYRIGRHATHLLGRFPVESEASTLAVNKVSVGYLKSVVIPGLDSGASRGSADPTEACSVTDRVDAYAERLSRDAYVLRGITRLASTLTMLAIVLELGWGLAGGSGLMGLQAGLPERTALSLALASACAGAGSALLYLQWAGRMRRLSGVTVRQLRDLTRVSLDRAHEHPAAAEGASQS